MREVRVVAEHVFGIMGNGFDHLMIWLMTKVRYVILLYGKVLNDYFLKYYFKLPYLSLI